ncbi:MAG: T9SS type A sorting domain-containing protein [Winogradskyella sp.]|uniref:T9SS type A sorting domain-containing protein n=1 Tax=Winogradskyella sp. TaxID=1883156 RepID=UPI00180B3BF8|nr:T9SS type A sorting domain-containing protein [Winogradskyella sp.]MBT8245170.1 T9SS type A sorting domain-containing protein [Winogradskyella sp.]NNK22564.1 T9SS type A sorting domain-containing protein [Winogradskyella sp.]
MHAQVNDIQLYGFVHSLIDHNPPLIPVPNSETATPYWVNEIAQSATNTFAFTGQFGQIPNHVDNLPPSDNLGYSGVATPWDSSTGQTFSSSNINTIIVTAANFIQWVLPTNPDLSDPMERSIVNNTVTLFDWTNNEIPDMRYYIYGNWPEMNTASTFPPTVPTQTEIDDFHSVTIGNTGTFDNWWIQYQDAYIAQRPLLNVKLIPVGKIISQIYTQILPSPIPFDELYEDSAPHGRANTYFLAGLITYMALYEQEVPATYMPSNIIHSTIRNNLTTINNFIWQELNDFNFPNGESRVFYSNVLSINDENIKISNIFSNPVVNKFRIKSNSSETFSVSVININGTLIMSYDNIRNNDTIDMSNLNSGVYFIRLTNSEDESIVKKMIKK